MKIEAFLAALPQAGHVRRARTGEIDEVTLTLRGGSALSGVPTEFHSETLTLVTRDGETSHLVVHDQVVAVSAPRSLRRAVTAVQAPRIPVEVGAFERFISDAPLIVNVADAVLHSDDESRGDARAAIQTLFETLEKVSAAARAAGGKMLEVRRILIELEDERGEVSFHDGGLRYALVPTPGRLVGLRDDVLLEGLIDLLAER